MQNKWLKQGFTIQLFAGINKLFLLLQKKDSTTVLKAKQTNPVSHCCNGSSLYLQWIWGHLRNTPLEVSVRVCVEAFPEASDWRGDPHQTWYRCSTGWSPENQEDKELGRKRPPVLQCDQFLMFLLHQLEKTWHHTYTFPTMTRRTSTPSSLWMEVSETRCTFRVWGKTRYLSQKLIYNQKGDAFKWAFTALQRTMWHG